MRRTKIIATLGPSTDAGDVLRTIIAEGVDVVRLNAAHSELSALTDRLEAVRLASRAVGRHVAVMLDLPGPKLRVGEVSADTVLESGHEFRIESGECLGDSIHACVSYPELVREVTPGSRLLVDDGQIELLVRRIDEVGLDTEVVVGGPLGSHKGLNVPGVTLGLDAITDRDCELAEWAVANDVDFLAQSFVRGAEDVARLRECSGRVPIIAKIEKHEAVDSIDEIVQVADALMVARGDLGVEVPIERVPVLQRSIVAKARAAGKPVIIATQMLESMTSRRRPTRAEASDVANAIFERVDALMLSGETAVGEFPVDVVRTMSRIAESAEASLTPLLAHTRHREGQGAAAVQQAVSDAVVDLAQDLGAAAIITPTQSGATARAVARHRPSPAILAPSPSEAVARRLALVWGITPLVMELEDDTDTMLDSVLNAVCEIGLASRGQRVAITAGRGTRVPGGTDFILVTEA